MDSEGNDLPQQPIQSNSTPSVTSTQYEGLVPHGIGLGQEADTEHLFSTQALFTHTEHNGLELLIKAMHAVCLSLLDTSLVYGLKGRVFKRVVSKICEELNAVIEGLELEFGSFSSSASRTSTKGVAVFVTWSTLFLNTAYDRLLVQKPAARASLLEVRDARLPLFAACLKDMWLVALTNEHTFFEAPTVTEILTRLVSNSDEAPLEVSIVPEQPALTKPAPRLIAPAVTIEELRRHVEATVVETAKNTESLAQVTAENAKLLEIVQRLRSSEASETRRPTSSFDSKPSDTGLSTADAARLDDLTQAFAELSSVVHRPQGNIPESRHYRTAESLMWAGQLPAACVGWDFDTSVPPSRFDNGVHRTHTETRHLNDVEGHKTLARDEKLIRERLTSHAVPRLSSTTREQIKFLKYYMDELNRQLTSVSMILLGILLGEDEQLRPSIRQFLLIPAVFNAPENKAAAWLLQALIAWVNVSQVENENLAAFAAIVRPPDMTTDKWLKSH